MQIAVQLLAFYLLTYSILRTILFFMPFRPPSFFAASLYRSVPCRSFLFLLILNSLMSFINRFQLIAIASALCRASVSSFLFHLLLLVRVGSERELWLRLRLRVCECRSHTLHCIANHLNINNPITIAYFSIFSFGAFGRARAPRLVRSASVYRCHYFEFYGFDFECCWWWLCLRGVDINIVVVFVATTYHIHIPPTHMRSHFPIDIVNTNIRLNRHAHHGSWRADCLDAVMLFNEMIIIHVSRWMCGAERMCSTAITIVLVEENRHLRNE